MDGTGAGRQTDDDGLQCDIEKIPYEMDAGIGAGVRLGLLILRTDQTIEDEFRFLLPDGEAALYGARLFNATEITPDTLAAMEPEIAKTAGLLPDVAFSAVGYGCTSGALTIGESVVAARIRSVLPGVPVTDPVTAALAALRALGIRRVGLLTPYLPVINHALRAAFIARGLEIPVMGSFNEPDDDRVARITPESIERAIMEVGSTDLCEGVFISCTSMRVARIAEKMEARLGKPVTSSNHALAWHMLRLSGVDAPLEGRGMLFRKPLA